MPSVTVQLAISADACQRYYTGQVTTIQAKATDGRVVHFPANTIRQLVGPQGVHGTFTLTFDDYGKLTAITKVR